MCELVRARVVSIDKIIIPPHRRAITKSRVESLADSIRELGLMNAISLRDDMTLIAGRHRIAAYRRLGLTEIQANIFTYSDLQAELAQIDENLERSPLTDLEHSEQLNRRKAIYESLHPETKRGGDRRSERTKGKIVPFDSFANDTAKKLGVTPRSVNKDLEIDRNLDDQAKELIRGTPIANKKGELHKLGNLSAKEQKRVAKEIAAGKITRVPTTKSHDLDWNDRIDALINRVAGRAIVVELNALNKINRAKMTKTIISCIKELTVMVGGQLRQAKVV